MSENINPSYFSILTADVRYNKKLSSSEKIFFSEISALTNLKGYCTATNDYFSKLYDVSTRTIQNWLSNLESLNLIVVRYENSMRYIFIRLNSSVKKNFITKKEKKILDDFIKSLKN